MTAARQAASLDPAHAAVAELSDLWGTEVVEVPGRGGARAYAPRPVCTIDLLVGIERWADRTYLVQGRRRITFARFHRAVGGAAAALSAAGARPGERVLIQAYNSPEVVLLVWAAWWLGAVPVLGNRWWSPQELTAAATLSEPALVVTDLGDAAPALPAPVVDIASYTHLFDDGGAATLDPHRPPSEEAPAVVLFTSGSSGQPKGVVLPHRAVVANQHNLLLRSRKMPQSLDPSAPQEVMLTSTPLFHIGGLSNLVTQLLVGGRLVLSHGRFDAGQILELIETEGVHRWAGVPTTAARVLEHPDFESRDLSSLRSFPIGGAPVPTELLERMRTRLPQLAERGLANTWGLTESGGFVTLAGNQDLQRHPGTVGRPYPVTELRIADPDAGGVGEVLVRAPTVMLGYLGHDDGTVDADGWLHTGDLGRLDDEGYLFLEGRLKDIVIRGGENVSCAQVEHALLAHPDVREAAVVGLPHPDLGEEVAAVVAHRPGVDLSEADLRRFLKPRLAGFAIPTRWRIGVDGLPTLSNEKIDKTALRERF